MDKYVKILKGNWFKLVVILFLIIFYFQLERIQHLLADVINEIVTK
jgi:hypothetical protein